MIKVQEKTMQVWLGELHSYTCGYLVGKWIELPTDEEEIQEIMNQLAEEARRITKNPYAGEEWYLGDWENIPFPVHQYDSIFTINEKLQMIADWSDTDIQILEKFLEVDPMMDFEDAVNKVKWGDFRLYPDCYSMKDVAYYWYDELGDEEEAKWYFNLNELIEHAKINWHISPDYEPETDEEKEMIAEYLFNEYPETYKKEWYIDFEAWGREMEMLGDFHYLGDGLYVELIW